MKYHLGVHCSVAGGVQKAFDEAEALGIDTFQIFTANQRQWKPLLIPEPNVKAFRERWEKADISIVFSHASYLINLGSEKEDTWHRSVQALVYEVLRCDQLGLPFTVLHPGSAGTQDEETALKRIADGLKQVLAETKKSKVQILLEVTAGQGSTIGYRFEHIRYLIDQVQDERIAACFDTCHAHAAGYDLSSEEKCKAVLMELDQTLGLDLVQVFHLNDSKKQAGARVDRHEHIGKGTIGVEAFRFFMNHFLEKPKVIETPKSLENDRMNLTVLRNLVESEDKVERKGF
jgi:deoxyribonuclease-4